MAYSRNTANYSEFFHALARQMDEQTPDRFFLRFPTEKEAKSLRVQVYAFIRALETEGAREEKTHKLELSDKTRMATNLRSYEIRIGHDDKGYYLMFLYRDASPLNHNLMAQLDAQLGGGQKNPTPPDTIAPAQTIADTFSLGKVE